MELLPLGVLMLQLQRQGFQVVYDEDHRGNRWLEVYKGDPLICLIDLDSDDYTARIDALIALRRAGFRWPD